MNKQLHAVSPTDNGLLITKSAWQQALIDAITEPEELFEILKLDKQHLDKAKLASQLFPLRVPRSFATLMQAGNINDPLLQQILPLGAELNISNNYQQDPLDETAANKAPGLLHKYKNRVLLIVTSSCAINCRYCFRRHFAYDDNNPSLAGWQQAIDYIQQDEEITEVILSGGDPLLAPDRYLQQLHDMISAIPHVKLLRIHSRLPIVLPERINEEFLNWFSNSRLKPVLVTHSNHPNEISEDVRQAMQRLKHHGVTLLNQSVLLRGINDDAITLTKLSQRLFAADILPYYLHTLDKVQGTAHFAVKDSQATSIYQSLLANLPGYLVPRFVTEIAGQASKSPIFF